jgi:hypothetical protein
MFKLFERSILFIVSIVIIINLHSCGDSANIITDIISNNVTAKDRLDSAYAQAIRKYGTNTKLVLILGRNVIFEGSHKGKTDISIITALSDPNILGAWMYVFKKPNTDTLAVYTPDPVPGERDCIELTAFFNLNTLLDLVADTSARNIISGTIQLVNNSNFNITTQTTDLIDSDVSLDYANSTSPIIKFNSSFIPDSSSTNGDKFFSIDTTNTVKTVNMFLIPGLGTLNLPQFITSLTGFPADLWIVNYKKSYPNNDVNNLVLGTVVENNQTMGINLPPLFFQSSVINLSKYVNELN